jgi:hypothetical protein
MAKKTTKAQRVQRVRLIYELLLSDTPRPTIIQYCSNQWGVSAKTADNYVKSANVLIVEEAARMRENVLEKHLVQRAHIRHRAFEAGDQRLAFDILRDESKLLDLYPSAKHEVTGADGGPVKVIRVETDDLDWDANDE